MRSLGLRGALPQKRAPAVYCYHTLLRQAARWRSTVVSSSSPASKLSGDVKPFEDIPGPGGPPYFGTYFRYKLGMADKSKLFDVVNRWHHQYGPIFKETCLGHTVVHVADPDAFRAVYAGDGKWPRIAPLAAPVQEYRMKSGISLGLGNSNDEEWYQLRSAAQKLMMRPKEVLPFLPAADQVAIDFVSHLKKARHGANNEVPDFEKELGRWSLESSGVHCFNKRLGYLTEGGGKEADDIVAANTQQFAVMGQLFATLPLYQLTNVKTPKWRKLFVVEDFLYQCVLKHLNAALEELRGRMEEEEEGEQFRFLRYLLSREELSKNDVAILTSSLFLDPLSTIKPQLQFLLYLLATTPRVQDKLYEEVQAVAPDPSAPLTPDAIRRMPYFRACFKESVRVLHMTNENARFLKKDLVLGGYHLPEGTLLYLNHFTLYRQPEYFSNPDDFDPDRWLQEEAEQKIDPIIVQPFSVGPRMCIGRRFAEQDMAMVMTRLLQQFRLEWNHPPMGMKYQILNVPDCPPQYTFLDR